MESLTKLYNLRKSVNMKSIISATPLTEGQVKHLSKVYAAVLYGIVMTFIGSFFYVKGILALNHLIAAFGSVGCVFYLGSTSSYFGSNVLSKGRVLAYSLSCFFFGNTIGQLIKVAIIYYPGIVEQAAFFTAVIFLSFSIASLLSKDRKYIYLGGILSSVLSYMFFANFFNIFFRSKLVDTSMLYMGILVSIGYILYDTQVTIACYDMGYRDYLMHAIELYTDIITLFVRILIVLMKKEREKEEKRRS